MGFKYGVLAAALFATSQFSLASAPHVHGAANLNLVQEDKTLFARLEAPLASIVGFEYRPEDPEDKWKLNQALKVLKSPDNWSFSGSNCSLKEVKVELPWDSDNAKSHHEHDAHDHDDHKHDDEHEHDEHGHDDHKHDDEHEHDAHDHDDHKHDDEHEHDAHDHDDHKHDDEEHDAHDHDDHKHDDEHEHDAHDHDDHKHDDEHEHDAHDHDDHKHDDEHEHDHDHDKEAHGDISVDYEFTCKAEVTGVSLQGWFNQLPLMESLQTQWISAKGQGAARLSAGNNRFQF